MSHDPISRAFIATCLNAGFQRKATTGWLPQEDTVAVLNLQRSQYGPQYYVNVALWLNDLGAEARPQEHKCHIRTRLGQLLPNSLPRLDLLLDLESRVDDSDREVELIELLTDQVIPIIRASSSLRDLAAESPAWPLERSLVTGSAQQLLKKAAAERML